MSEVRQSPYGTMQEEKEVAVGLTVRAESRLPLFVYLFRPALEGIAGIDFPEWDIIDIHKIRWQIR